MPRKEQYQRNLYSKTSHAVRQLQQSQQLLAALSNTPKTIPKEAQNNSPCTPLAHCHHNWLPVQTYTKKMESIHANALNMDNYKHQYLEKLQTNAEQHQLQSNMSPDRTANHKICNYDNAASRASLEKSNAHRRTPNGNNNVYQLNTKRTDTNQRKRIQPYISIQKHDELLHRTQ